MNIFQRTYCSHGGLNVDRVHLSLRSRVSPCIVLHSLIVLIRVLVGSSGLEPPTSRLSAECSNQLSYKPICLVAVCFFPLVSLGGDEGNRTPDPLLAGQVLSQLSYTPIG